MQKKKKKKKKNFIVETKTKSGTEAEEPPLKKKLLHLVFIFYFPLLLNITPSVINYKSLSQKKLSQIISHFIISMQH